MHFEQEDLDFDRLSPGRFEELCFELVSESGFRSVTWRQGGGDQGRDIEAWLSTMNCLLGQFDERWFFECKRYSAGVPPNEMSAKVAWADAERPNHLVFLLTSHLTNDARSWIEKLRTSKPYSIHIIEGKALKARLLSFPDLLRRYFLDETGRLLEDAKQNWLLHDLLPEPEMLAFVASHISPTRFFCEELAFTWCCAYVRASEIETWCEDNEGFSFDGLFGYLKASADSTSPVLGSVDSLEVISVESGIARWSPTYHHYLAARLVVTNLSSARATALYALVWDCDGAGVEVLTEGRSELPTRVRYLASNSRGEAEAIIRELSEAKG